MGIKPQVFLLLHNFLPNAGIKAQSYFVLTRVMRFLLEVQVDLPFVITNFQVDLARSKCKAYFFCRASTTSSGRPDAFDICSGGISNVAF
jgi:hypothetical protein